MADSRHLPRLEPYCQTQHGNLYLSLRGQSDPLSIAAAPATFPNPLIGPRQHRPHSIHIVSYPPGFIPRDLRSQLSPGKEDRRKRKKKKKQPKKCGPKHDPDRPPTLAIAPARPTRALDSLLCFLRPFRNRLISPSSDCEREIDTTVTEVRVQERSRPVSLLSIGRRLSRLGDHGLDEESMRQRNMVEQAMRPPLLNAVHGSNRDSILSAKPVKGIMSSSVTEILKPVASGSGVSCSILLAEPNVFLTGFEHEGHPLDHAPPGTALLRGKLVLTVSKNVKIKSVTLKLVGRARTEWPEGIPPLKIDMFEEQSLRTQGLTFFHAMHDGWTTEFGNQCTYSLKGASNHPSHITLGRSSPAGSNSSVNMFMKSRTSSGLTAKELKRLSLQSVQSRSFGKGDSPSIPNQVQVKGYKVFYPGTYEYSFELPIDHHQLETTKLPYGSVRWQLETVIERAGAFRPNLNGAKEVNIVRVPDQLSLEMSEPISISRQWEDQLHYDIVISGKSFPIGAKVPIAFKLTPLAKVQVHKIKVFVTEHIEYWTNDRRVTRKDAGRRILLLEKTAGRPVDKQYEASDIRVVRGGELTPDERAEARAAAARRRALDARGTNGAPQPLPEPTENILGDLDLGLESYWASTEMEINVQIPTCQMMAKEKALKLHPDCSWKNVNVFHWIKIVMRISRADPEDPSGKRRRHFEISIDSPFTVLNCLATQANTALPRYSGMDMPTYRQNTTCGCPDAHIIATEPSPASSTGTLPMVEIRPENISSPGGAALLLSTPLIAGCSSPLGDGGSEGTTQRLESCNSSQRATLGTNSLQHPRPIHLIRVPSYNPPPFDADDPPPPMTADLLSPPPNYDLIVGTPSVDGLADYFARLADYEDPTAAAAAGGVEEDGDHDCESNSSLDEDEPGVHTPARLTDRSGRVNIANPRTPGGRNVPSRSFDMERPAMQLSMDSVARRGEGRV